MAQFGVSLPNFGKFCAKNFLVRAAREAEALGYDSVWVSDHIVIPAQKTWKESRSEFRGESLAEHMKFLTEDFYEPLTTLTYLSAVTKKIKLGTSCLIIPYRNPMLVAKMAATLDNLSEGRLILGVSHGWVREEFDALGVPFEKRGKLTDESIQAMMTLWHEREASFHGEFFSFNDMVLSPKPLQKPHPPVWVGGHKRKAMERAVNFADGWHPTQFTPEQMKEEKEKMVAYAKSCGKNITDFVLSMRLSLYITDTKKDSSPRRPCTGTLDEIKNDIKKYKEAGVTHFVFDVLGKTQEKFLETMKTFAEKIIRSVNHDADEI